VGIDSRDEETAEVVYARGDRDEQDNVSEDGDESSGDGEPASDLIPIGQLCDGQVCYGALSLKFQLVGSL
jgi:hypothetical protein